MLINCAELQGATDAKIVSDSPVADLVNRRIQLYFKAKAEIIEEAVAAATSQPRTETGSGSKPGRKSSV